MSRHFLVVAEEEAAITSIADLYCIIASCAVVI